MPLPFMPPQVSQRQIDWRGILPVMDCPHNDTELHRWLRWVFESRKPPYFVCTVAEAALGACMPDYLLLRPVLLELKRQHPEPQPGGARRPRAPRLALLGLQGRQRAVLRWQSCGSSYSRLLA